MPRVGGARTQRTGGGNRVVVEGPMGRICPRCQAKPGWRCGRYVGAVWTAMATFHRERKLRAVRRMPDATGTRAAIELRAAVLGPVEEGLMHEAMDRAEEWHNSR